MAGAGVAGAGDSGGVEAQGMTAPAFAPIAAPRFSGPFLPTLVIDTREQTPLVPLRLPYVRAGLQSGDYSVLGLESEFAVERKSIADLVACCKSGTRAAEGERERFERELHRMRGFTFARLLIVGTRAEMEAGAYRSDIVPSAVVNSLLSWQATYRVPFVCQPTPEAAALEVEDWAYWYARKRIDVLRDIARAQNREQDQAEKENPK
jgi:ERCC4-type nuclease